MTMMIIAAMLLMVQGKYLTINLGKQGVRPFGNQPYLAGNQPVYIPIGDITED